MRSASLASFVLLVCACGGSSNEADLALVADLTAPAPPDLAPVIDMLPIDYDAGLPSGPNIVPIVVDGYNGANVGFVDVTVCVPGTSTCQTIDHVMVDTGSVGLRLTHDAIDATLLASLPVATIGGNAIAECYRYESANAYGSVRTADVLLGGELAPSLAIQTLGGVSPLPSSCGAADQEIITTANLGAKGIIGIAGLPQDCGTACIVSSTTTAAFYYSCTGGTCTPAGVPLTQQVTNPVVGFATDNNGYIVELPAISDYVGGVSPTGTITFGIGTQSNNALTNQTVYTAEVLNGFVPTLSAKVGTTSFGSMLFDSGTQSYALSLPGITECTGTFAGYYCPASLLSLTANLTDKNGATGSFDLKIASDDILMAINSGPASALDDLATDPGTHLDDLFVSGMSGFFGRKIYFGISGKNAGAHAGPFFAF